MGQGRCEVLEGEYAVVAVQAGPLEVLVLDPFAQYLPEQLPAS